MRDVESTSGTQKSKRNLKKTSDYVSDRSRISETNQKLSYRLENRASTGCVHLIIRLLPCITLFEFNFTLRVGSFLAKIHVMATRTHASLQE